MKEKQIRRKSKRLRFERLAPPGRDLTAESFIYGGIILVAFIFSTSFFSTLYRAYKSLFHVVGRARQLIPGAVMPDFVELSTNVMGFFSLVLFAAPILVLFYRSTFQAESKSIYLMKRLPDRWELFRRTWGMPVFFVIVGALFSLVLVFLYFAIYMIVTPESCLQPDQWGKLWTNLLRLYSSWFGSWNAYSVAGAYDPVGLPATPWLT